MSEPSEAEIKLSICEYLSSIRAFFWVEQAGKIPGRRYSGRFYRKGKPDILGSFSGTPFGIEVKKTGGRQSPDQKAFAIESAAAGWIYILAYSVTDVVKAFSQWRE